jgi:hypothetical protein
MRTATIVKASLRLVAGCSIAVLVVAGGAAFAHGGGGHNGSNNNNGNGGQYRSSNWGQHNGNNHNSMGGHHSSNWSDNDDHRHHHHHHHKITSTKPPLHGAGSSHNPIVYHPPVKTIVGTKKPVLGTANPGSYGTPPVGSDGGKLAAGTAVRDHRNRDPRNGQLCQYTVGDQLSYRRYLDCVRYSHHWH